MENKITILGSTDFSLTIHTYHLDIPSREQSAFHIIELDSFKYHELSLTSENIDCKLFNAITKYLFHKISHFTNI